jgi:hypothetical protein
MDLREIEWKDWTEFFRSCRGASGGLQYPDHMISRPLSLCLPPWAMGRLSVNMRFVIRRRHGDS